MPVTCPECGSEDLALVADLDDGRKEVSCDACGHSWLRGEKRPPTASPASSDRRIRKEIPDVLIVAARVAYPEYFKYQAYVTHAGRSYSDDARWLAFLSGGAIQPEVPEILYRRDHLPWTVQEAEKLESSGDDVSVQLADIIRRTLAETSRTEDAKFQAFLLSAPDDPRTIHLPNPVQSTKKDHKGAPVALTFGHRYTLMQELEKGPSTTDELGL